MTPMVLEYISPDVAGAEVAARRAAVLRAMGGRAAWVARWSGRLCRLGALVVLAVFVAAVLAAIYLTAFVTEWVVGYRALAARRARGWGRRGRVMAYLLLGWAAALVRARGRYRRWTPRRGC